MSVLEHPQSMGIVGVVLGSIGVGLILFAGDSLEITLLAGYNLGMATVFIGDEVFRQ